MSHGGFWGGFRAFLSVWGRLLLYKVCIAVCELLPNGVWVQCLRGGPRSLPACALRAAGLVLGAKSVKIRPCGAMETCAFQDEHDFFSIILEYSWGLSNAIKKFMFNLEGTRFHGAESRPCSKSWCFWPQDWGFSCSILAVLGAIVQPQTWASRWYQETRSNSANSILC